MVSSWNWTRTKVTFSIYCCCVLAFAIYIVTMDPPIESDDSNYVAAHSLLSVAYFGPGTCGHFEPMYGDTVKNGLISCSGTGADLRIVNMLNGTVLEINRRFRLEYFPGTDDCAVLIETVNGYAFLACGGMVVDFVGVSPSRAESIRSRLTAPVAMGKIWKELSCPPQ